MLAPPGLGLFCTIHAVPFQRSTSVRAAVPLVYQPTAQASLAEVAATPRSWLRLLAPPGLGLFCNFQAVPFQCSTSVRVAAAWE